MKAQINLRWVAKVVGPLPALAYSRAAKRDESNGSRSPPRWNGASRPSCRPKSRCWRIVTGENGNASCTCRATWLRQSERGLLSLLLWQWSVVRTEIGLRTTQPHFSNQRRLLACSGKRQQDFLDVPICGSCPRWQQAVRTPNSPARQYAHGFRCPPAWTRRVR